MFMAPWSKECEDDLAMKCSVPGTFFTSKNPESAQPLVLATRVTPLPHRMLTLCGVLVSETQLLNLTPESHAKRSRRSRPRARRS